MPIYEYQCEKCQTVTDIRHGFKETTDEQCPQCGGNLKRLFRPAGIVFKGSGFYVTDSRKSAEAKSDAAPGSAATPAPATGTPATPAPAAGTAGPKSDAAA